MGLEFDVQGGIHPVVDAMQTGWFALVISILRVGNRKGWQWFMVSCSYSALRNYSFSSRQFQNLRWWVATLVFVAKYRTDNSVSALKGLMSKRPSTVENDHTAVHWSY